MDIRKNVIPENLPTDINAETLLDLLPDGSYTVSFHGLHKRNTYRDIVSMEADYQGRVNVGLARLSLYNSLPEFMFHPIDRFDNLPKHEEKERFEEQLEAQQEEIEDAYRFFSPFDILLLKQRMDVKEKVLPLAQENVVMQQIIGDRLTEEQRSNRFVRQFIPFLPQCKDIRGNKTFLTLLLRKVFLDEGLKIHVDLCRQTLRDDSPRYEEQLDMTLGDGYVGNEYEEMVTVFNLDFWSDEACDEHFLSFIDDVEGLRLFIQDWFLAVGEELRFNITQDSKPLRLNDEVFYNYLNYNTNI